MPKNTPSTLAQRKRFIAAVIANGRKIGRLYHRFGFCRALAYKLWARYQGGGWGALAEAKRGPRQRGGQWRKWTPVVLALRKREPSWGPKKLRYTLAKEFGRQRLPSLRTMARMLQAAGCSRPHKPAGPSLPRPELTQPRRCNEVWTIDFKGHFYTEDGARCLPLTVRDLHSRFLLLVQHVVPSQRAIQRALRRLFRRHGVPQVLRVDNGKPFGGEGARGLTALSVWWIRLGIQVEFILPRQPQENGAHEQMHAVLKAQTARPPAPNLRAQAARFRAFRAWYNERRMHERHAKPPAEIYRAKPGLVPQIRPLHYPAGWIRKRVSDRGLIRWAGRVRMIGRAFRDEYVGLEIIARPKTPKGLAVRVYLGSMLLGELHAADRGGLRAARYRRGHKRSKTT
jgi:transposase